MDRRTDVWAFGCVLYELLSGRRAFPGDRVSDVIAKVIEREPDFGAIPDATPPALRRLLERCLVKDPRRRLRNIGDARIEVEEILVSLRLTAAGSGRGHAAAPRTGRGSGIRFAPLARYAVTAMLAAGASSVLRAP